MQTESKGKTRLWEKGEALDAVVHRFTVGNDPELDLNLLRWDAIGSAAQARMITSKGFLSQDELAKVLPALKVVLERADRGEFVIPAELEDCHTAIETFLTEELGEIGKKIHVGRSRNDQVLITVRLWIRSEVVAVLERLYEFLALAHKRCAKDGKIEMPGYTHMQRAMPGSIGMWLGAFGEWALEAIQDGLRLFEGIDCNPLGASAGFGEPLGLDREMVASLLGFSRVQRNPMAILNSRGRYELKTLRWLSDVASMCEKLACDMMLYSMEEFKFISLPVAFTTGSSIMPQKRNPDVLELMRARGSLIRGKETELSLIISKLPSSYHRDHQLTKEPIMRAVSEIKDMLTIMSKVIAEFSINEQNLEHALSPELYATYDAYHEVLSGKPFRDAYRQTAEKVKKGAIDVAKLRGDFAIIQAKVESELDQARKEAAEAQEKIGTLRAKISKVEAEIFG